MKITETFRSHNTVHRCLRRLWGIGNSLPAHQLVIRHALPEHTPASLAGLRQRLVPAALLQIGLLYRPPNAHQHESACHTRVVLGHWLDCNGRPMLIEETRTIDETAIYRPLTSVCCVSTKSTTATY